MIGLRNGATTAEHHSRKEKKNSEKK